MNSQFNGQISAVVVGLEEGPHTHPRTESVTGPVSAAADIRVESELIVCGF